MIEHRSAFANQLEFEIDASKDHWSELDSKLEANRADQMDYQTSNKPQILGHFRRKLAAVLFCCKCPNCSILTSNHNQDQNQVESLSILARFRRRLGALFLCFQCANCGVLSCSRPQHGNQLECVELEEADSDEETNREIFESIRKQWGGFFNSKWGDNLELGPKIAEGGQAEIFEVESGIDRAMRMEFVVKAFKRGYSLRSLQTQHALGPPTSPAILFAATVLKDDRFAFVMHKYWGDLRKLIDLRKQRNNASPPFPHRQAVSIMLQIATGMHHLHTTLNIPHRDLKASNVLIALNMSSKRCSPPDPGDSDQFSCVIADYECSAGVLGTGFWRAPEVLLAMQRERGSSGPFTQQADVYSFAMTSYEVLTGCVPFEELGSGDWEVVVRGRRPQLPHPMNSRVAELLCRCWHSVPAERPCFAEIASVLEIVQRGRGHGCGLGDECSSSDFSKGDDADLDCSSS